MGTPSSWPYVQSGCWLVRFLKPLAFGLLKVRRGPCLVLTVLWQKCWEPTWHFGHSWHPWAPWIPWAPWAPPSSLSRQPVDNQCGRFSHHVPLKTWFSKSTLQFIGRHHRYFHYFHSNAGMHCSRTLMSRHAVLSAIGGGEMGKRRQLSHYSLSSTWRQSDSI